VRLFTDRDVGPDIGLALRQVGVEVELYRERYTSGMVPDERWIAEVTSEALVILTKDTHIRTRPSERTVFEAAGARAFVLATRGATRLVNLRAVLIAWPRIETEVGTREAPFMFGRDRAGVLTQYVPPLVRTARARSDRYGGVDAD
jgi:hypothetical protein